MSVTCDHGIRLDVWCDDCEQGFTFRDDIAAIEAEAFQRGAADGINFARDAERERLLAELKQEVAALRAGFIQDEWRGWVEQGEFAGYDFIDTDEWLVERAAVLDLITAKEGK